MSKELTLQALIKLKNHFENTLVIDETDREQYNETLRAINWVEKQNGESNNNGWFKKEEELPEDSDVVLWLNINNYEYELASLLHCDFEIADYTHWSRVNEKSPIY